jgi:hypothetical protein
MIFVGEKKLGVMALDDVVDFLFKSVNVIDELGVVFVDLLVVGEFFCLGQKGIFAFFRSVCAHGCLMVEIGRRDYKLLWGFAFVHAGTKLIDIK